MRSRSTIILIFLAVIYSCSHNKHHSDTHPGITIETIGPRGSAYTDSTGKVFGFRVFRTRVTNDKIIPVELTINFSNDSVVLRDSMPLPGTPISDMYVKVFLFPRSMTPDKQEEVYNYGIKGIESFLDTGLGKPTVLKATIQPKEDYFLYIGALLYPAQFAARSNLFLDGQNLVYKISINPPLDSALIPCGQIVF